MARGLSGVEVQHQKIKKMIKKAIISGGGTGGHIFPAIAIADGLISEWREQITIWR